MENKRKNIFRQIAEDERERKGIAQRIRNEEKTKENRREALESVKRGALYGGFIASLIAFLAPFVVCQGISRHHSPMKRGSGTE